jgi:alanine dehydrogenase
MIESGLGSTLNITDQQYMDAGPEVLSNRQDALAKADVVLSVNAIAFNGIWFCGHQ